MARLGIAYMTPQQLRGMMEQRDQNAQVKPFVVVDVRDYDYAGGHIRGSVNIPATQVIANSKTEGPDATNSRLQNASLVIFHCYISKHRAPQCAKCYKEKLMKLGRTQEVAVLEGGYYNFWTCYSGNTQLLEDETLSSGQVEQQRNLGVSLGTQFVAAYAQQNQSYTRG